MATDYLKQDFGQYFAAEDLGDHQYRVVQLNTLNPEAGPLWQKPSVLGNGVPVGVLRNAPGVGCECIVQFNGVARVELGGSAPIEGGRQVGILEDGTVVENGNFGVSMSAGQPGDIIEVLLGGSRSSTANFSYEVIPLTPPVVIPTGQQMTVHGCLLCNEGQINIDGTLFIEE